MIPLRKNLQSIFAAILDEREHYHDWTLPNEERIFLVDMLVDEAYDAINKYIQGSKEHNPEKLNEENFLNGVDHLREIENELIDFRMYVAGLKRRLTKGQ